ncbi:hypothetical protein BsWGS_24495 [Bradybaena similaris]
MSSRLRHRHDNIEHYLLDCKKCDTDNDIDIDIRNKHLCTPGIPITTAFASANVTRCRMLIVPVTYWLETRLICPLLPEKTQVQTLPLLPLLILLCMYHPLAYVQLFS